jgi:glyoxylase-like metal-dependent hydrolase (beta-lactamase superfamily II)
LIDTGCAHTALELAEALSDRPVSRILNTHSHEDHIGTNHLLQQQREGMEIFVHPSALPILADPRRMQPLHPYRRLMWGWPEASAGNSVTDGAVIETEHYCFQVIYTPGHSPDHLCLYESTRGWLFTGDLFVGGKDRALRADHNIWEIIASLKKIAALPANTLFPGCARVRMNPTEEIQAKIGYLEDLGERVLDLHDKGWGVQRIVRSLCGGPIWVEFLTLGHFSRRHLVLSYLRNAEKKK